MIADIALMIAVYAILRLVEIASRPNQRAWVRTLNLVGIVCIIAALVDTAIVSTQSDQQSAALQKQAQELQEKAQSLQQQVSP